MDRRSLTNRRQVIDGEKRETWYGLKATAARKKEVSEGATVRQYEGERR